MVTWIVERYVFDEEQEEALIKEVKAQGHKVIELNPMKIDTLNPPTSVFMECFNAGESGPVMFRGSLDVAREWAYSQVWSQGIIYNRNKFNCSKYYAYWGKYLMNNNYELYLASKLLHHIESGVFRSSHKFFLRPDSGDKDFRGGVYDLQEAGKLLKSLSPETLVIESTLKVIESEYRFVIEALHTPRVVTYSHYKGKESIISLNSLLAYVEEIISEVNWHPDPLYVLDVGIEKSHIEPSVIELNSFSCSDLYGSDVELLVRAANKVAEELFEPDW